MAAGDFLEVYTEEGAVSLSVYFILAKGLIRLAPHEAESTTSGKLGGGGGGQEKGVHTHSRFPLPLSRHMLLMTERASFRFSQEHMDDVTVHTLLKVSRSRVYHTLHCTTKSYSPEGIVALYVT